MGSGREEDMKLSSGGAAGLSTLNTTQSVARAWPGRTYPRTRPVGRHKQNANKYNKVIGGN